MCSINTSEIRQIETLLSEHLKPNTNIIKHVTRPLTAPGENYGSVIVAVDVTIQEMNKPAKILHLVAKQRPANEMLCDVFNIQLTFKKEIKMYVDVIPALTQFQQQYGRTEKNIGDLFAKCYGGRINLDPDSDFVNEDAVLILENLKIDGYDVGDRLEGFDYEHVYRILEDLARFHAVPIAYKLLKPEEFNLIVKPAIIPIKVAEGLPEDMKLQAIVEVIDILKEHKECIPYLDKIHKTLETNLEGSARFLEAVEPFGTIIHTDYWVNNTMILKNEQGKPIKNKIIDLQMPAYNTGAMDLIFFLYSSVMPEILYDNVAKYIKYYYKKFIECLQEFKLDISEFCWENFDKEINRTAMHELGHILVMYKPILTRRGAIDDMSNLDADTMLNIDCVNHDYADRITNCVLSFIKNKWI